MTQEKLLPVRELCLQSEAYIRMPQTVDKVSHYCAGFFFAKYQNVQCLCGFFGTFLV